MLESNARQRGLAETRGARCLGAPRVALRLSILAPWLLVVAGGWGIGTLGGEEAGPAPAAGAVAWLAIAGWLAAAWTSASLDSSGEATVELSWKRARKALRGAGEAALVWSGHWGFAGLLAAVAALGSLLARVPGIGAWLLVGWQATVGLALALACGALAVVGVGLLPLVVPACVHAPRLTVETYTSAVTLLRHRSLALAAGLARCAFATALALVPFVAAAALAAALIVAVGALPEWGIDVRAPLAEAFRSPPLGCPLGLWWKGDLAGPATRGVLLLAVAFALASLQVGATRLYFDLHRELLEPAREG